MRWGTIGAGVALAMWLLAGLAGCGDRGARELRSALREMDKGNWVKAKTLLESAISRHPGGRDNARAYNYLGVANWQLSQAEAAVEAFEFSRTLDAAFALPCYNLGVIHALGGDLANAFNDLELAAQRDEKDLLALLYLGRLYADNGKWSEARRAYYTALKRDPLSAHAHTAMACLEMRSGHPDKAQTFLMQALDKNPDYPPALFNLGLLWARDLRDMEKARPYFEHFLEEQEAGAQAEAARQFLADMSTNITGRTVAADTNAEASAAAAKPEATPESLMREAEQAYRGGEPQKAVRLGQQAADIYAQAGDGKREGETLAALTRLCFDQSDAFCALGRYRLKREDFPGALHSFKQAVALNPKSSMALLGLAQAAIMTRESDAALVALKQVIKLEPSNPDAVWALAMLYDKHLDVQDKALETYRLFERTFPGDPRVLKASERIKALAPPAPVVKAPPPEDPRTNAPAVLALGDLNIRRPVERKPAEAVKAFNRAMSFQTRGDLDNALFYYLRALEQDDSFVNAYYNLGLVFDARGEFDKAITAYRYALERQRDWPDAHFNLALSLSRNGEIAAARQEAEKLLAGKPDYAPALQLLGYLSSTAPETYAVAIRSYRRFLEVAPNDPAAPAVRRWLEEHAAQP